MSLCYWALLFMHLVTLHHLLNVFVQLANKWWLQKKRSTMWCFYSVVISRPGNVSICTPPPNFLGRCPGHVSRKDHLTIYWLPNSCPPSSIGYVQVECKSSINMALWSTRSAFQGIDYQTRIHFKSAFSWFPISFINLFWRCRRYIPPKRRFERLVAILYV
jgi:hypothetical protein